MDLHLVVPGSLEQLTGGYLYDARMVAGLRRLEWQVGVHELPGAFPAADAVAHASLTRALVSLPDGARVLIDGLAMGGAPEPVQIHCRRLRVLGLVHHPLADETGLDPVERGRLAASERTALAACIGVIVTSDATASRARDYGVPPDRVRVVPPGTDPAPPSLGPMSDGWVRLLCVATLIPRKGHDVLVRALSRLGDLPWSCVCAGGQQYRPTYAAAVQQQVRDAGLADRIRFAGECQSSELDELYCSSSVFVLPSHYEGYGMALSEALARGLPIVSTTGGAIPDTVPGDVGILVAPGDDQAMARAIARLTTDRSLRMRCATAARRHAATLPDWNQAAVAFAHAIESLDPGVA